MLNKLRAAFPQVDWRQEETGRFASVLGYINGNAVRVQKHPRKGLFSAGLWIYSADSTCVSGHRTKKPVAAVKSLLRSVAEHRKTCVDFEQAFPKPQGP